ncbi:hypothetical protein [Nocardia sp. NPDC057227]|uniref:hypothetical protein n=1 Tax=Nocardia sp. NPDC057227 TaxID=3346056 RepID=UPI00362EA468
MAGLVATAFSSEEAAAVLADPELLAAWAAQGAAFAVIGIDRLDPDVPASDLDPSLLGTALAAAGGPAVLVAAAAHIDLPYNLARRILSLDHLTRGRAGVLLGVRDTRGRTPDAWSGAGLGTGAELGPETAAEVVRALTRLWWSWPLASVVADRESGILVRSDRIRRVDQRGVVTTAGPLSVPASVQGAPVLAWYGTDPPDGVDFTLASSAERVLLRTVDPGPPTRTAGELLRATAGLPRGTGTLREILGLPTPADPLPDAPAAFPAPSPDVYR